MPVHDPMIWGLVGTTLRGAEYATPYARAEGSHTLVAGTPQTLAPGQIEIVSSLHYDVHEDANAQKDQPSTSVQVYGGNIGEVRRHVFDLRTAAAKDFISGYSSDVLPNIGGMN